MTYYRATVELFLASDKPGEVEDAVSALLSENGVYHPDAVLRDWAYSMHPAQVDPVFAENRGVFQEEYFSEEPNDGMGLFEYEQEPRPTPVEANTAVLESLMEIRNMLTAGRASTAPSSYEAEVIDKIDQLMRTHGGAEIVRVEFFAPRADLLALFNGSEEYGQLLEGPAEVVPTPTLLSHVLQHALYDIGEGPQMEGEYKILSGKKA